MNKSKKLYFFLNPFAGKGTAYNIFEKLKKVLDKQASQKAILKDLSSMKIYQNLMVFV